MNNKLPNVFVNKDNVVNDNNKEYFYGSERNNPLDKDKTEIDSLIVKKKISEILSSPNFVYKMKAKVTLKDEIKEITIIGRRNNNLILMDSTMLNIDDILDIETI